MIGVYQIVCNDNIYVGSSSRSIEGRWGQHLHALRNSKHCNPHLQNAFNKYGEESLIFSVLENISNPNDVIKAEQKWIDELNPKYNICQTAGSLLGTKLSDETKARMSAARLGGKRSAETRAKMSAAQLGCKPSDETRAKLSASHMGNKSHLGKKHSNETRAKISAAHIGKKLSDEHKAKISRATLGHEHSDEARAKMSAANICNYKAVKCLEENRIFKSIMDAAKYYNIQPNNIGKACRGERKTCGGFHWDYVGQIYA